MGKYSSSIDELHRRHGIFPPKALDGKKSFSIAISQCTLHALNVKRNGVSGGRDGRVRGVSVEKCREGVGKFVGGDGMCGKMWGRCGKVYWGVGKKRCGELGKCVGV